MNILARLLFLAANYSVFSENDLANSVKYFLFISSLKNCNEPKDKLNYLKFSGKNWIVKSP
jgi:hypothetical protein